MVEMKNFCLESLITTCQTENPDDLWLEYQRSIPADIPTDDLIAIKNHFYATVSDLLCFEELADE